MTTRINLVEQLPVGTRLTISGLAFGDQYPHGVTQSCAPGQETLMVISEVYPSGATLERIKPKPPSFGKAGAQTVRSYGPPSRKRWP